MQLTISRRFLDEIFSAAINAAPEEICGLLFGENGQVSHYLQTPNVAEDRTLHFEIDPAALITAERERREGGPQILGYFHSHPGSNVEPSRTDADAAAADGRVWMIVNDTLDVAAWRTVTGGVTDGKLLDKFDAIPIISTLD